MTAIATELAGTSLSSRAAYQLFRNVLVGFCRVWCRMTVIGREHIPAEGAFILAPSHRSIIDTPIASGVTRRRLRFMGADKWWRQRQFGWLLSALGGFPVTRGSADREALMRCVRVLEGGEPLVLFPEGERKSGAVIQPLFDGAAYIAVKAGVPIVPVGIGGSERVMPKGARFIFPHRVVVVVGEPIAVPPDVVGKALRVATRDVTATVHSRLQELFDDAQRRAGVVQAPDR
jgi:1-acyl-sn-glycerol-3-phosphate acyltransferase